MVQYFKQNYSCRMIHKKTGLYFAIQKTLSISLGTLINKIV